MEHNIIVLVVNNIVMNNSTYYRNFKDSNSNKDAGHVSYKPSLGKLFCDAANVRLRIDYPKLHNESKYSHYIGRNSVRKIVLEKDIVSANIDDPNYNTCVTTITNKGLEDVI